MPLLRKVKRGGGGGVIRQGWLWSYQETKKSGVTYYNFLNVYPFDYTAFVVSGKAGLSLTGLTTLVGWLLLLQLPVLSRSAIVV